MNTNCEPTIEAVNEYNNFDDSVIIPNGYKRVEIGQPILVGDLFFWSKHKGFVPTCLIGDTVQWAIIYRKSK